MACARLAALGSQQTEARKVGDSIYVGLGFGNTFLVATKDGNVIIDTSLPIFAARHKALLTKARPEPVKYVILTHAHEDHTGGLALWTQTGAKVIAQKNFPEVIHYQDMLAGFFGARNAAQFGFPEMTVRSFQRNRASKVEANILFDERYDFDLGGLHFELHHTPGETPDACSIWIPELKAAFVGDNLYPAFPNIYTLRGTRPRWATDYITSLDKVRNWQPEYLLPSHGEPIEGREAVAAALKKYRDAIAYVHDATVRGMNEGKDVHAVMREVKLPPELAIPEIYGEVSWSVRGIYEGYVGWFDGNPANMYSTPVDSVYPDMVELAGGADAVAERARKLLSEGSDPVKSLHLAEVALRAEPKSIAALQAKQAALEALKKKSANAIEEAWLESGLRKTRAAIKEAHSPTTSGMK
ncbi:MAG: alkyl sulfatase dimerization domain-containing protein [Planctomycetota bacterium]